MADEYDGRVVIDTELDNSGFEKGSDKLKQSVSGLARALEQLSGTASKTFMEDWKDIDPAAIKPEIDTEEFDEDVAHVKAGLKDIQDTTAGDLPEPEPVQPTIDSAEFDKATDKMQARLNRVTNEVYRIVSASSQGFRNTAGVLAFDNQLSKATDTIEDAKAALKEFAEQQIPTDEYAETTAAIEKTEGQLQKLYDKASQMQHLGVDETSKSWTNLMDQIEQTDNRLRMYEDAAKEMEETGAAFVDPKATEQYEEMREQIQQAEAALQTNVGLIRQEQIEQARMNVLTAQEKVANAGNVLTRKLALAELQKAQNKLAAIAQKSVTPAPDPKAASAWQRFGNVVGKVGGTVLKVGRGIGSVLGTIGSVTKKITGGIKGLLTRARGASGVDGLLKKLTSIKGMLISRIKHTFISELFNDISEAFKELAKFDSRFDRSISNMKNRTKELGANVMGALGGLIRQIEPYITALIDRASEGVTKISAVFAALRGESTVQVAVRQTESYADSLRDATKEAKAAKTAQEKYNTTLTSYDEIHKLADNSAAADDTNAGSEAERELYQNVPVGSILRNMDETGKKIVDRLVQAVKDGDWKGAGNAIAEGFNLGVRKLDEAILGARERVINGARNLAEALNGLTDGFDAYAVGKTIADGINLAIDTGYAFLTTYDFKKLGLRMAEGLNGLVDNFDAAKFGDTIVAAINGAIDWASNLVGNFNFDRLGRKIGEAFNRLFGGGSKISERSTKDVGGAARDAYLKSVGDAVTGIDWAGLAKLLSDGIKGVFDTFSSFFETTDWEKAGEAIVEFLTNVDWDNIADSMFRLLGSAIGGIAGLIKGAFKATQEKAYDWGASLFDEYGSEFEDAGDSVAQGVWNGIKAAFKNCANKVKDKILRPFIKGFNSAFSIHSPSKEMEPLGENVANGIFEGIRGIFSAPANWIKANILEPLKTGFNTAFSVVGTTANALKSKGETIANGIKSGISSGWGRITSLLSEKKDEIQRSGDDMASAITGAFSKDKFRTAGQNVTDGLGEGIGDESTYQTSIGEKISNLWNKISGSVNADGIRQVGKNITWLLGEGVGDEGVYASTIGDRIRNLTQKISDSVDADGIRQVGRNITWILNEGMQELAATPANEYIKGSMAEMVAAAKEAQQWSANYEKPYLSADPRPALLAIEEIGDEIDELDGKEIKVEADAAASSLDRVADKLAGIAQIFQTINRAFTDFTRVPLPAIVTGAYAPAGTRVTDISGSGLTEIRQMLGRFLDRAAELEEKIDSRPVRVDVHAEIDKREIARATAEVRQDNSNINNGGGGRW